MMLYGLNGTYYTVISDNIYTIPKRLKTRREKGIFMVVTSFLSSPTCFWMYAFLPRVACQSGQFLLYSEHLQTSVC